MLFVLPVVCRLLRRCWLPSRKNFAALKKFGVCDNKHFDFDFDIDDSDGDNSDTDDSDTDDSDSDDSDGGFSDSDPHFCPHNPSSCLLRTVDICVIL